MIITLILLWIIGSSILLSGIIIIGIEIFNTPEEPPKEEEDLTSSSFSLGTDASVYVDISYNLMQKYYEPVNDKEDD